MKQTRRMALTCTAILAVTTGLLQAARAEEGGFRIRTLMQDESTGEFVELPEAIRLPTRERNALTETLAESGTGLDAEDDGRPNPLDAVGTVVRIGRAFWDFVKDNKPVAEVDNDHVAVLPKGVEKPFDLTGWQEGRTATLKILIEDALTIDLVSHEYHVRFDSGGRFKGKGAYLANVAPVNESLTISAIGIKYSSQVKTFEPTVDKKTGVVQLRLHVVSRIDGLLGSAMKTDEFTISGEGSTKVVQRSAEDWN